MGYVAMVVATLPYEGDAPLQIIEKLSALTMPMPSMPTTTHITYHTHHTKIPTPPRSRFLNNQGQALLGALGPAPHATRYTPRLSFLFVSGAGKVKFWR